MQTQIPMTHVKLYPLEAAVFFIDGNVHTVACCDEQCANEWIDHQFASYGLAIVATDIYPALTTHVGGQ